MINYYTYISAMETLWKNIENDNSLKTGLFSVEKKLRKKPFKFRTSRNQPTSAPNTSGK